MDGNRIQKCRKTCTLALRIKCTGHYRLLLLSKTSTSNLELLISFITFLQLWLPIESKFSQIWYYMHIVGNTKWEYFDNYQPRCPSTFTSKTAVYSSWVKMVTWQRLEKADHCRKRASPFTRTSQTLVPEKMMSQVEYFININVTLEAFIRRRLKYFTTDLRLFFKNA